MPPKKIGKDFAATFERKTNPTGRAVNFANDENLETKDKVVKSDIGLPGIALFDRMTEEQQEKFREVVKRNYPPVISRLHSSVSKIQHRIDIFEQEKAILEKAGSGSLLVQLCQISPPLDKELKKEFTTDTQFIMEMAVQFIPDGDHKERIFNAALKGALSVNRSMNFVVGLVPFANDLELLNQTNEEIKNHLVRHPEDQRAIDHQSIIEKRIEQVQQISLQAQQILLTKTFIKETIKLSSKEEKIKKFSDAFSDALSKKNNLDVLMLLVGCVSDTKLLDDAKQQIEKQYENDPNLPSFMQKLENTVADLNTPILNWNDDDDDADNALNIHTPAPAEVPVKRVEVSEVQKLQSECKELKQKTSDVLDAYNKIKDGKLKSKFFQSDKSKEIINSMEKICRAEPTSIPEMKALIKDIQDVLFKAERKGGKDLKIAFQKVKNDEFDDCGITPAKADGHPKSVTGTDVPGANTEQTDPFKAEK